MYNKKDPFGSFYCYLYMNDFNQIAWDEIIFGVILFGLYQVIMESYKNR